MLLGLELNRGGVMAWKSGQSYSADWRSRVLAAVDEGVPARTVAQRFRVSLSYIYQALGRRPGPDASDAPVARTDAEKSPSGRRSRTSPISPANAPIGAPDRTS